VLNCGWWYLGCGVDGWWGLLTGISIIVGIVGVPVTGATTVVLRGRIQDVSVVNRFALGGGLVLGLVRVYGYCGLGNIAYNGF